MSYCVNCGVELAPSEPSCPLCGTPVQNPRQPLDEQAERPYPRHEDPMIQRLNRRFVAMIVTIALAFPASVCLAIDWSNEFSLSWSLYVTGALGMIWCWFVPNLLYLRPTFLKVALPVSASLLGFLWLVERLQAKGKWFLPFALPLVILLTGFASLLALLAKRGILRDFSLAAAIAAAVGLFTVGIELVINQSIVGLLQLRWSWFVLLPALAVAAASLAVDRRQKVRTEILKRLHW